jgi:hypothetical protein
MNYLCDDCKTQGWPDTPASYNIDGHYQCKTHHIAAANAKNLRCIEYAMEYLAALNNGEEPPSTARFKLEPELARAIRIQCEIERKPKNIITQSPVQAATQSPPQSPQLETPPSENSTPNTPETSPRPGANGETPDSNLNE